MSTLSFNSVHTTPVAVDYSPTTGELKVPGYTAITIHCYHMKAYTHEEAMKDVVPYILRLFPHLQRVPTV